MSKQHRRDVVIGDFEKKGHEYHVRLFADADADDETHWIDFQLYEVAGVVSATKQRLFERKDGRGGMDTVEGYEHAETAAEGFVKGDGCTQFEMSHVHADSKDDLIALFAAVLEARKFAAEEMPGTDIVLEYNRVRGQRV